MNTFFFLRESTDLPEILDLQALFDFRILKLAILVFFTLCIFFLIKRRSVLWGDLSVLSYALLIFVSTLIYSDEVYINLEHTYNLFHFNLFSFSPTQMVDGTIELFYYLMLYPFAGSTYTLIVGNILVGSVIALAHAYLIRRIFTKISYSLVGSVILSIALISIPSFFTILSNGFGNSLVSLGVIVSIYYYLENRSKISMITLSVLPIFRPDAVLISAFIYAYEFIKYRKIYWPGILILVLALASYFITFYILYGKAIPNPIDFKSTDISAFMALGLKKFTLLLFSRTQLLFVDFLFAAVLSIWVWSLSIYWISRRQIDEKENFLLLFSIYLFGLGLFYFISSSTHISYDARYFVSFFPMSFIAILVVFKNKISLSVSNLKSYTLVTSIGCLLVAFSASGYSAMITRENFGVNNEVLRTKGLEVGGHLANKIVPEELKIAVTELNTFGFFLHDREVIDLWGYTNPLISKSTYFSPNGRKIYPSILQESTPDIIWLRTVAEKSGMTGDDDLVTISESDYLKKFPNYHQLGDENYLEQQYVKIALVDNIRGGEYKSIVLCSRDSMSIFLESLDANGYKPLTLK